VTGSSDPILAVRGVSCSFDGRVVLRDVSFEVAPGSVTALIGPNGAGKTTLFNVITGFLRAEGGEVEFDGQRITGWPAHRIARRGLVRTFQTTRTLRRMKVLDNLLVATPDHPGDHVWAVYLRPGRVERSEQAARARAQALLERFNLERFAASYAGVLSGGQRKLLDLARALMLRPRLLLLDEPMAGINPVLGRALMDEIARLNAEQGLTILFVEHDMPIVMAYAQRVIVMAEGQVLSTGTPAEVRRDQRVVDAYLGSPA
jgi:branched-chain amino acid transport system ATP-binding protein